MVYASSVRLHTQEMPASTLRSARSTSSFTRASAGRPCAHDARVMRLDQNSTPAVSSSLTKLARLGHQAGASSGASRRPARTAPSCASPLGTCLRTHSRKSATCCQRPKPPPKQPTAFETGVPYSPIFLLWQLQLGLIVTMALTVMAACRPQRVHRRTCLRACAYPAQSCAAPQPASVLVHAHAHERIHLRPPFAQKACVVYCHSG